MDTSYDVLKEPWIPVVDLKGKRKQYGILDTLSHAQELQDVADSSPLVEYAIYRFLCVFLMDAIRPEDISDIEDILDAERFDMDEILDYVGHCKESGASFDLFDKRRPFLQAAYVPDWDKGPKSIGYLDHHIPSGNNHIHFHHLDRDYSLSYAEALQFLLVCHTFSVRGGRGYYTSINGDPPYFTLVKGDTLFQTLVYTLLPINTISDFDSVPVYWNCTDVVEPGKEVNHTSWLYGMLFPARRVSLIPQADGIRTIYFSSGMNFKAKDNWTDPHVTYMIGKRGRQPLCPGLDNPIWKNLNHLINISGKMAPQILQNYSELYDDRVSIAHICLYGVNIDSHSLYQKLFRNDLALSTSVMNETNALVIGDCIGEAEQLGVKIEKCLDIRTRDTDSKSHGIGHAMSEEAIQEYYHRCEAALWELCSEDWSAQELSPEARISRWKLTLYQLGREVIQETLDQVNLTGKQWIELYRKLEDVEKHLAKLKKDGEVNRCGKR